MSITTCSVQYCIDVEKVNDIAGCSAGYAVHPDLVATVGTTKETHCLNLSTVQAMRMEWSKVANLDLAVRNAFLPAATTATLNSTQILDLMIALDYVAVAQGQSANVIYDAKGMRQWLDSAFGVAATYTVRRAEKYLCQDAAGGWGWRDLTDCHCGGVPCASFNIPGQCL